MTANCQVSADLIKFWQKIEPHFAIAECPAAVVQAAAVAPPGPRAAARQRRLSLPSLDR